MMAKKDKEFHMLAIVAIVAIVGLVLMFTNADVTGSSVKWVQMQEDRQGVYLPGNLPLYQVKYSSDESMEAVEEKPMYAEYDSSSEWGQGNVKNRGVVMPGEIPFGQSQYTTIAGKTHPEQTAITWESREPCYSPRLSLRNCKSGVGTKNCVAYEEMLLKCLIDKGIATECHKGCVTEDVVWGHYDEFDVECFRNCGYSI